MAMGEAFRFIDRYRSDKAFRCGAYETATPEEFKEWIARGGFHFSDSEIDDAFRSLLLKAKDEEEAEEIRELGSWYWLMTGNGLSGPVSSASCASCASKTGCSTCRS
ncbi:MAG: Nif11-like leader peptide family natural product precursor [Spirochaetales bacterium]|nr:Nif11-like leader peptide family natural product precursor [Spirochaetales bacterium]